MIGWCFGRFVGLKVWLPYDHVTEYLGYGGVNDASVTVSAKRGEKLTRCIYEPQPLPFSALPWDRARQARWRILSFRPHLLPWVQSVQPLSVPINFNDSRQITRNLGIHRAWLRLGRWKRTTYPHILVPSSVWLPKPHIAAFVICRMSTFLVVYGFFSGHSKNRCPGFLHL